MTKSEIKEKKLKAIEAMVSAAFHNRLVGIERTIMEACEEADVSISEAHPFLKKVMAEDFSVYMESCVSAESLENLQALRGMHGIHGFGKNPKLEGEVFFRKVMERYKKEEEKAS